MSDAILTAELERVTAERDRWMEDSMRQTHTINRLAAAIEDRNKVDAIRHADYVATLAAAEAERDEARSERQREHDLRVKIAGELETAIAQRDVAQDDAAKKEPGSHPPGSKLTSA
jgi:urease accessory protein UreF